MKADLNITFYKEEKFKETPIGKIPEEWEVVRLGDVVEVHDSKRIPLSEMERSKRKGPYPYCGANGVIDYIDDYIFDGEFVLLAEDGGNYGKFENTAYIMKGKFWVNNHAHILQAIEKKAINSFILFTLNFLDLNPYIVGSTRKKLNQEQMKKIKIPLPPLPEQKTIAHILSTIDEAIQKTDEIIEKTDRLKKGLMQELLTKGIGHKEFKDTEIGRIPKEWEVVKLKSIGEFQYGITASATKKDTGLKLLRITDITDEGIKWKEVPYCDIAKAEFDKYELKVGDVLFARIGATTGKTCYIDRPVKAVFGSYLIRFKPKIQLNSQFLYFYTQSPFYWNQVNRVKEGQLKKGLNTKTLGHLLFILPPISEQQKITEILSTVDKKLEIERKRKEKLERIKKVLMDLLLTGKIRVKLS